MPVPTLLRIERAGLAGWPALETETDGGWVLRASGGYTRRANSIQSLDLEDEARVADRLSAAVRWYGARGLPAIFRVTPLTGPATRAALADWVAEGHSHVVGLDLADCAATPDRDAEFVAPASASWLAAQQQLQGYDDAARDRLCQVVARIEGAARGILLRDEAGDPVASALMSVADGIVVTGNVVTARAARRRGLGRRLMLAGLDWARSAGARYAAHAVEAGNGPALALHDRLGYRPLYDYHYRRLVP